MAQVRGSFPDLYDRIEKTVKTIIFDTLQELKPIYKEYTNMKSSSKKFERVLSVTPFGDVPQKDEGQVYALDLIRPGWTKDFVHVEFGLGFEITETALEDDEFDVLIRSSEMLAWSARYVQEKQAADAFLNLSGPNGSAQTPDGVSIFNTAHVLKGGGTARNMLAVDADLSIDSLATALQDIQLQTKMESGQLVAPISEFNLVVPPGNEMLAERLVSSSGLPGTAENDINPVKRRKRLNIIVNPLITDTDAWYLIAANKRMHGLTSYVRIPTKMAPKMQDPFTGNFIYKIRFRQSWGAWMWQGLFGSVGS
jgi:hypothetical protein